MEKTLVTVIVPVYNVEKYISECIESIMKQTYSHIQIILIDDGSIDASGAICDNYAKQDGRIEVIHKQNGGVTSARKCGLKMAKGEYIACVDADDWIEEDTFEKLLSIGQGSDVITYACYEEYEGYRILKQNLLPEGLYSSKEELNLLYLEMLMYHNFFEFGIMPHLWDKLIRRSILLENQMLVDDSVIYGEDAACVFPCIIDAKKVYITNLPLYHYRQRIGSAVKSNQLLPDVNFSNIYHIFMNKINILKKEIYEELKRQLIFYMWFLFLTKGYEKIQSDMVVFPYKKVKPHMKIAIYGLGGFGKTLSLYCMQQAEVEVVAVSDLHYDAYRKQGIDAVSIDEMLKLEYDVVLIAILNERLAVQIKNEMLLKGIKEDKIDWVKEEVLIEMELKNGKFYNRQIFEDKE